MYYDDRLNEEKSEDFVFLDKTLNDVVPQLIPREPVNIDGVKPGFNTIRSNIPTNESIHVEIDPTSNAPIAVFDGKTIHSSILLTLYPLF